MIILSISAGKFLVTVCKDWIFAIQEFDVETHWAMYFSSKDKDCCAAKEARGGVVIWWDMLSFLLRGRTDWWKISPLSRNFIKAEMKRQKGVMLKEGHQSSHTNRIAWINLIQDNTNNAWCIALILGTVRHTTITLKPPVQGLENIRPLLFIFFVVIKPENLYFASCPGLEVIPLGVYPFGPRSSSCGPTKGTPPSGDTLRAKWGWHSTSSRAGSHPCANASPIQVASSDIE